MTALLCRTRTGCGGEGHLSGVKKAKLREQESAGATPTCAHTWVRARRSHLGERIRDAELVETSSFPSSCNLPFAGAEDGETGSASAFCGCYFHFVSGFSSVGTLGLPVPQ